MVAQREIDITENHNLYRLSFGGNLSMVLLRAGYIKCGTCLMDNGKEGTVFRKPDSPPDPTLSSD